MRAYAELYNGNPADAVVLATWAVEQDPTNAAWATLLAELLIGLGRWDDAAGLLEKLTPLLDDSQELWRNLAVVRAARGDASGAKLAEQAASAFDVG
jgi:predicted Zn-dependent protease